MAAPPTRKSIAMVICSTRPGRVNPAVGRYIESFYPKDGGHSVKVIDLKSVNLPMFDEPTIPAALPANDPTPGYKTEHARAWSREIRSHDALVFVTPQYNWSLPATVKNAIDYLYHEWAGKSAVVVSYGGHGGGKSREALEQVLTSVKMKVAKGAEITLPVREGRAFGEKEGAEQKDVPEGLKAKWKEAGVEEEMARVWGDIIASMEGDSTPSSE